MAKFKYLRWYSVDNDWMDCVITVNAKDADRAKRVVADAMDAWWDDDQGAGYGEAIEEALTENEILYNIRYHRNDDIRWDEDWCDYEKRWEDSIPEGCEVIN